MYITQWCQTPPPSITPRNPTSHSTLQNTLKPSHKLKGNTESDVHKKKLTNCIKRQKNLKFDTHVHTRTSLCVLTIIPTHISHDPSTDFPHPYIQPGGHHCILPLLRYRIPYSITVAEEAYQPVRIPCVRSLLGLQMC